MEEPKKFILTKRCIKCGWTKPLGEFALPEPGGRAKLSGTSARCKTCLAEMANHA